MGKRAAPKDGEHYSDSYVSKDREPSGFSCRVHLLIKRIKSRRKASQNKSFLKNFFQGPFAIIIMIWGAESISHGLPLVFTTWKSVSYFPSLDGWLLDCHWSSVSLSHLQRGAFPLMS